MEVIDEKEWIDGDKFEDLADIKLDKNLYDNIQNFEGTPIVYCATEDTQDLFKVLINNKKEIILLTHNSDNQIRDNEISKPVYIKIWYANNYVGNNSDIISIPTGLERVRWYVIKRSIMKSILNSEKNIINLAYSCFSPTTNLDRIKILKLMEKLPYVTVEYGTNGGNFERFFNNLYSHVYIICPVGNSTGHSDGDCAIGSHRFWESLYMGSIPIVLDRVGNRKFDDLPVLYVDKWEDITEKLLLESLDKLNYKWNNIEQLNFSYWRNKIKIN